MKKELFRNFEIERSIGFQPENPVDVPKSGSEAADTKKAEGALADTAAKSKEQTEITAAKATEAVSKSALQIEAYIGTSPNTNSRDVQKHTGKGSSTDIITGAKVRYIPNTEGPINVAYTAGGEYKSGTKVETTGAAKATIKSGGTDAEAPAGSSVKVMDINDIKLTGGVEGVVPVGPVDLFAGVGMAGGIRAIDTVGIDKTGKPIVEEGIDPLLEVNAQAGARVNIGPGFLSAAIGVNKSITDDEANLEGKVGGGITF